MASRGKPLTVKRFVERIDENGNKAAIPVEELSEEEYNELRRKNADRIAAYFSRVLPYNIPLYNELCQKGIIKDAD